jgi:hypothetical protein
LQGSLIGYLSDKFNLPQIEITSPQVKRFLGERNMNSHLAEEMAAVLEECNFARFAPTRLERADLEALFDKAKDAIMRVEKVV